MFQEIGRVQSRGEAVAVLTVIRIYGAAPCAPGTKMLVRADGSTSGSLAGAITDARARDDGLRTIGSGQPELVTYHLDPEGGESVGSCGASLEVFIEPVRPEPRLVVVGSGYVAQALARFTAPTGWRVTLLDDRTEFLRVATLPDTVRTEVGDLSDLLMAQNPDPMTAIVIVTRGHHADRDALRQALTTPAGYIGMIGSMGKIRQVFRSLLREGVSSAALARVYSPIGLDLHAETPDEIALSITAELLRWRRGGTGHSLRDEAHLLATLGDTHDPASDAEEFDHANVRSPEAGE